MFHNLQIPEHSGAKNPGLILAYKAATLNPEILKKKILVQVRVGKIKSGLGRVAGIRLSLTQIHQRILHCRPY